MKWGTSASVFNSFVCSLRALNRSLKVHTGKKKNQPMTEKIQEKSHKQKRQTARILRNPKNPTKPNHKREHRSEGFATTVVQYLSRAQGV